MSYLALHYLSHKSPRPTSVQSGNPAILYLAGKALCCYSSILEISLSHWKYPLQYSALSWNNCSHIPFDCTSGQSIWIVHIALFSARFKIMLWGWQVGWINGWLIFPGFFLSDMWCSMIAGDMRMMKYIVPVWQRIPFNILRIFQNNPFLNPFLFTKM